MQSHEPAAAGYERRGRAWRSFVTPLKVNDWHSSGIGGHDWPLNEITNFVPRVGRADVIYPNGNDIRPRGDFKKVRLTRPASLD